MRCIKIVQDQMDLFQGGCCSGPFLLNSSDRPSVLARIEKFSNLPVINFFFTVIKTKDQLFLRGIWADKMRKKAHKLAVHVFRY